MIHVWYIYLHLPDQSTIFNHDIILQSSVDPKNGYIQKKSMDSAMLKAMPLNPSGLVSQICGGFGGWGRGVISVKTSGLGSNLWKHGWHKEPFWEWISSRFWWPFMFLPQKIVFISCSPLFLATLIYLFLWLLSLLLLDFCFIWVKGDICFRISALTKNLDISTWKNMNTFFP